MINFKQLNKRSYRAGRIERDNKWRQKKKSKDFESCRIFNMNRNSDAGKMKRREYSGDFMLNSDSYYIRHNSRERIDYRSHLRDNFTSSFYFQMF